MDKRMTKAAGREVLEKYKGLKGDELDNYMN